MNIKYLDFEKQIAELDEKINELRRVSVSDELNISQDIEILEKKSKKLTASIFSSLTPWQISQLARHPQRPYLQDYIPKIFENFQELKGDRNYSDDQAILGGFAELDDMPVMVIGHQKGRDTKDKITRNFGMANPEGFRKAKRLMELAAKFNVPILTFIDTPGAYPGIGAEERGQSEAIAKNLLIMSELKVPIVCTVLGEGCSGGALAIGVGDKLLMLEYSTFSVISPEGCASILWKDAGKADQAAAAMNLTAERLHEIGIVDTIVKEPLGGAHRNLNDMSINLKEVLIQQLSNLKKLPANELIESRYNKLMAIS